MFETDSLQVVMLNTTDNWYGNFDGNKVELLFFTKKVDGRFRVCVWGNDDFGMERDFKSKGDARVMFNKLKEKSNITQKELTDLGFSVA